MKEHGWKLLFVLVFAIGFSVGYIAKLDGMIKVIEKAPQPIIHHHLYYLDRSECKKPV